MEVQLTLCVLVSVAFFCCHGKADAVRPKNFNDDRIKSYCNNLCNTKAILRNGPACPSLCPQRYLGPWSKRSINSNKRFLKRSFDSSSDLKGIAFDDYSWFMKLLGRNVI